MDIYLKNQDEERIRIRDRYHNDPIFRQKHLERVKRYYVKNREKILSAHRARTHKTMYNGQYVMKRYRSDPNFRLKRLERNKLYYQANREKVLQKQKETKREKRQLLKAQKIARDAQNSADMGHTSEESLNQSYLAYDGYGPIKVEFFSDDDEQ